MDLIKELDKSGENKDQIIATELLVTAKAAVRTYAVALTETASPEVRDVLKRQLKQAIDQHGRIADYMMENNMYYAHDVDKQLELDKKKVKTAKKLVKDK
ncbi:spore coat protein [Salinicoccus halitifaciens]|uniref:Spore coat protein n=1 Tax=Salinicoccus halitifaciens TaxID=1073415 RepID=A0ABV2EB17_9STAP|nr:spore coat protein [Salinicoccus halitifaciens]MCD2137530.1 spore coat protein [Salinicoccus halitifaciens]